MLSIRCILVHSLLVCTAGSVLVCFSAQCEFERHPHTRSMDPIQTTNEKHIKKTASHEKVFYT